MTTTADQATGVNIGPLEQLAFGEGRAFDILGQQVAVFRLRTGKVYAIGAVCPHRGGPIADGQIDDTIVLCPLHMNAFELATGCSTTGQPPLPSYQVSVTAAGDVLVEPQPS